MGEVQGVGFRAYVVRAASLTGVSGEVWNRRYRGVEMVVSHPDADALDAFEARIPNGPGLVMKVIVETDPGPDRVGGFLVGPTR